MIYIKKECLGCDDAFHSSFILNHFSNTSCFVLNVNSSISGHCANHCRGPGCQPDLSVSLKPFTVAKSRNMTDGELHLGDRAQRFHTDISAPGSRQPGRPSSPDQRRHSLEPEKGGQRVLKYLSSTFTHPLFRLSSEPTDHDSRSFIN